MHDPQAPLKNFIPKHKFFIGIDSDGSVFDTMELKHKECFVPQLIKYWNLQAVSKYTREVWDFVSLYSKWRGLNRFHILVKALDLLREREEVIKRGVKIPEVESLRAWINSGAPLSNPSLLAAVEETGDLELSTALEWSSEVNRVVDEIAHGIPPFPMARETLKKMAPVADMVVISVTTHDALQREWSENDLAKYVSLIAGQEMGKKHEHLALAAGDKYPPNHVLMIGDAPGDLKAAKATNALFYPINPGHEEASWECLYTEALDKFLNETYAGDYEARLIAEFEALLPEQPPWK